MLKFSIAVSLLCVVITPASACAQQTEAAMFGLKEVEMPDDPDPAGQTDDERLKTLQAKIVQAQAALAQKDYKTFLQEYVDPFWLARMSLQGKVSVEELVTQLSAKDMQRVGPRIAATLAKTQEATPQWRLGGRFAAFSTSTRGEIGEHWAYYEGRWRISPTGS